MALCSFPVQTVTTTACMLPALCCKSKRTSIWHEETQVSGYDALVLPGGFSYGDYLRSGSIARFSPVMRAVTDFADAGGLVLGICNGFQILTEAGLLPGALLRNDSARVPLRLGAPARGEHGVTIHGGYDHGQVLRMPIAHGDGNYVADPDCT